MSSDKPILDPVALRLAAKRQAEDGVDKTREDLRVHQIELAMEHEELQRVHNELIEKTAELERLFEEAPLAYLEVDPVRKILRQNRAARELLGDLQGERLAELAHDEHKAEFLSLIIQPRDDSPCEVYLRGARGLFIGRVTMRRLGDRQAALVAIEDITVAHEAQAAVVRSEQRLKSLLDLAPDAIAVLQNERLVFVNQALCSLLGENESALSGRSLGAFLVGGTEADTDGDKSFREVRVRNRSGAQRVVESRLISIEYDDAPAKLMMMRDLTERRRMEARVARVERLATVGMLVSGVAHEINNPLAWVIGNLEFIHDRTVDDKVREVAREALEGSWRMAAIIKDLRLLQNSNDEIEVIRVNELVVKTIRMAEPKIASLATVSHDLGKLSRVSANEGRLAQVLLNLIVNASQAMPENRSIDENKIVVRTWSDSKEVCIQVEDNGVGIEASHLLHLYDPFYSTRKGEGGTGLGLAISNSLIEQLGGFIEVDSTVNHGSRFVVHLPRCAANESAPRPRLKQSSKAPPPPETPLRMLIVDDERAVARSLSRLIASFGSVEILESGSAAIERLKVDDRFDVILSDVVMLKGSGRDLADWLRAEKPHLYTRLVFVSGMPHPDSRLEMERPRLEKPFDAVLIRQTIVAVAGGDYDLSDHK